MTSRNNQVESSQSGMHAAIKGNNVQLHSSLIHVCVEFEGPLQSVPLF